MKAEGLRAGLPDLMLAVATQGAHGLFLEMKAKGGKVSPAQNEVMGILQEQGYSCFVAFGFEDARNQILIYLGSAK